MTAKPIYTEKQFLKAILGGYPLLDENGKPKKDTNGKQMMVNGSGGIVTTIAKRLGCDWHTANEWCHSDKHPALLQAMQDEKNRVLDGMESTVVTAGLTGDLQSAMWYLTKIGKHRGYGDEVKNINENVNAVEVHVHYDGKFGEADSGSGQGIASASAPANTSSKAKANKAKQGKA